MHVLIIDMQYSFILIYDTEKTSIFRILSGFFYVYILQLL